MLFGNTEIHASDLSQYYKKLNEIGENETTSIEEHFKVMHENGYILCHSIIDYQVEQSACYSRKIFEW